MDRMVQVIAVVSRHVLSIGFAPDILPPVSLFHMLFAVGFPLRLVGARREATGESPRGNRVLVVDMPFKLFRSRPAMFMVFARRYGALEGTTMRLGMFIQVTEPSKRLCTMRADMVSGDSVLRFRPGSHDCVGTNKTRQVDRYHQ